ncbi:mechanosensitive ion channel domain-containing protein [Amaricoccus macauensis]|uniref:mechanosensitive ion channel domain-containing protein n=1 Tax=Amaricoccus macauensis TaxID=57001 RepID=UPI003C7CEF6B
MKRLNWRGARGAVFVLALACLLIGSQPSHAQQNTNTGETGAAEQAESIGGELIETLREGAATATGTSRSQGQASEEPAETSGETQETTREPADSGTEPQDPPPENAEEPQPSNETEQASEPSEEDTAAQDAPAEDGTAEDTATEEEGATEDEARPAQDSIGNRLIQWFEERTTSGLRSFTSDLSVAGARFRALAAADAEDLSAIAALLPSLALLAGAGIGLAWLTRLAVRPFLRWLGERSKEVGPIRKLLIGLVGAAIDLVAMIFAGIVSFVLASALRPDSEAETLLRTSFLAAFIVVSFLIIGLRAFFSPASPHMRLVPFEDSTARSWTFHASVVIAFLTFSEVFAATVIGEVTRPILGQAVVMLINLAVLAHVATLVLVHRETPIQHVQKRVAESEEDVGLLALSVVVPYWHLAVFAYLAFLAHQALTEGGHGVPVLVSSLQIAVALALGMAVIRYLRKVGEEGLRLPPNARAAFPALETRINAFMPVLMRLLRWTVIVIWTAFVLQTVGVIALWDWIETRFGIDILGTVTSLMLIGFLGLVAWFAITGWIDYRLTPHHAREPSAREQTLLALLRNASLIAILLFVLITSLAEIGVSIAPLLASAGVVGLAIGFGSQKLVQDIITGVFIQFENAINVGDVIEAGGKTGVVEKLTIRSVSLRDVSGVFHVIPFSSVDLVSNHMMGYGFHVADIGVAYREDIDAAREEMLEAFADMQKDPEWSTKLLGDIEWFGVQELADSAVILRARLKTRAGEQWGVGRAYSERVKKRFDAAGIEIPFPHLTLWFGEAKEGAPPPAHVSLAGAGAPPAQPAGSDRNGVVTRQTVDRHERTDADGDDGNDGSGSAEDET